MTSCFAMDGEPQPYAPTAAPQKAAWRVYCGITKEFGYPDPDGKWERLYLAQEFWHHQKQQLENKAEERRKRAIVQVRREGMLKTRRDAHAMFSAHCRAAQAPPPPKLGTLGDLIPEQRKRAQAQSGERSSSRRANFAAGDESQRPMSRATTDGGRPLSRSTAVGGSEGGEIFLTRLTSTALSGHSGSDHGAKPLGPVPQDGSSSGASNDTPPWPTRASGPKFHKKAGKTARQGLQRINAVPSDKLRSAEDLWEDEDDYRDDDASANHAGGFIDSVKSAVGPSFPLKQNRFLPAPGHLTFKPTSIRAHLHRAAQMTEKRPTAISERPLSSTTRKTSHGFSVGPPPVLVSSPVPPSVSSGRRPQTARSARSQFSAESR